MGDTAWLQDYVMSELVEDGDDPQLQVRCGDHVADIVTTRAIYELLPTATASTLPRALSVLRACRDWLGGDLQMVVVCGEADPTAEFAVDQMRRVGVEIIVVQE